ncbi:MAG: hypothetical protein IT450_18085 [Phycisphaerales bacterium]|nr:hypothetical protein [Phycisphaerales bacterium]
MATTMELGRFVAVGGIQRTEFSSVGEMVAEALATGEANHAENARFADNHLDKMPGNRRYFNGYTRASLMAALDECPVALLATVNRIKETIESKIVPPTTTRRRVQRGLEDGDEMDPVAWLQCDPNGWQEIRRETTTKPIIRVGVNLSVSSNKTAEATLYRGAAAAAIADILTARGYSVEIDGFNSVIEMLRHGIHTHVCKVSVKSGDMPLNLPAVAFCLSEIAFFRAVFLAAIARREHRQVDCGMGYPQRLPADDAAAYDAVIDSDVLDEQAALAAVDRFVAKVLGKDGGQ